MKHFFFSLSMALLLAATAPASDTQNGLQVDVTKKTVGRNDTRNADYYYNQQIDRTMALHVLAKNVSFKEMPEGTIEYSLLVKLHDYLGKGAYELYTGTEKLPPLKVAETADVTLGSAEVTGWGNIGEQHKDKLDYKIVIKQNGAVTMTLTSNSSFDSLAKRATKKK